jgi:HK97 family phage major capsid protein
MSYIDITSIAFEQHRKLMDEHRSLTSGDPKKFSAQNEARAARLLYEAKTAKESCDPEEFRSATMNYFLREAGLKELPRKSSAPVERREQWLKFHKTGENDLRGIETRTNAQQSSQWGRVSGLTYTDYAGDGTGSQGGVLVPSDYDARLFASAAAIDGIIAPGNCNVLTTSRGGACTTPSFDDTSNSSPAAPTRAVRIGEAVQSQQPSTGGAGVNFDAVLWGACPTYRSGIVYVAMELDQDSIFAMGDVLERVFFRRFALAFGADCITGSGVEQVNGTPGVPLGLTTSLPASTAITSVTSTLALSDLETLFFTLGYQYRGQAKFYMSDTTRLAVAKLVSTANRNNGYTDSFDTLFGKEIVTCNSMNGPTAGSDNAVVFLHPDYYMRREVVGGQYIRRFQETAAIEYGLIGYQGYAMLDARPVLFDSILPPVASLNIHS